jgi:acyl carrier protein
METLDFVLHVIRSVAGENGKRAGAEAAKAINPDTELFMEADLDSVALLEILVALEGAYHVRLVNRIGDLGAIGTPAKLAVFICDVRDRPA